MNELRSITSDPDYIRAQLRRAIDGSGVGPYLSKDTWERVLDSLVACCVPNFFEDVAAFHRKFGLDTHGAVKPGLLPPDVLEFRFKFQLEENGEFFAAHEEGYAANATLPKVNEPFTAPVDNYTALAKAADALVDLVYVALGTAHMMGIDFNAHWALVQEKNMQKVRAASAAQSAASTGRGHRLDVVKPPGWTPPDHLPILRKTINDYAYVNERTDVD